MISYKLCGSGMINGGFMVLNKGVFNYIPDIDCIFEMNRL